MCVWRLEGCENGRWNRSGQFLAKATVNCCVLIVPSVNLAEVFNDAILVSHKFPPQGMLFFVSSGSLPIKVSPVTSRLTVNIEEIDRSNIKTLLSHPSLRFLQHFVCFFPTFTLMLSIYISFSILNISVHCFHFFFPLFKVFLCVR